MSDDYNKYSNINNNYFINARLSSIENLMDRAETYFLDGPAKKNYESALKIMFGSKSISIGGEIIPRKTVHKRLENISYEHIVYVDNNISRKTVDGTTPFIFNIIRQSSCQARVKNYNKLAILLS